MKRFIIKSPAFFILIALLVWYSSYDTCSARRGKQWNQSKTTPKTLSSNHRYPGDHLSRHMQESETTYSEPMARQLLTGGNSGTIFNVLDYGAKGDGKSDDTKAFEAAWTSACKVQGSTMVVPSGSVFLVKPISFSGPGCESNTIFQLDGKIIAPTGSTDWGSGLLQWIEFKELKGITIRGKGIIDGQGSVWWNDSPTENPTEKSELVAPSDEDSNFNSSQDLTDSKVSGNMPSTKPTALRFYGSSGITVTGITIQNSPQTHLKFDDCTAVQVFDMTASSPGDSPNTDGIHLQNSKDVVIRSTNLACGDDCISIQTGCSGVFIHNVNCGPGHGISIGGLGKDNTKACVSNITVRDTTMQNTLTGVRIKTWQGGSGSVQEVMFSNIQVSEVKTPIVIDQYYCDRSKCGNQTSAVAVTGITYQNIRGTYTENPVRFACSDNLPCTGVTLNTIELKAMQESNRLEGPFCWKTYGELKTPTTPPIDCLKMGKQPPNQVHSTGFSC